MQANIHLLRNDTLEAESHIEKSKPMFREIDKKTLSDPEILIGIARYFRDMNNYDLAETYYRKALMLDPENLKILNLFADFCITSNRFKEIGVMEKGMKLAPDKQTYCEFLAIRGMCLYSNGNKKEGADFVRQAWNEAPFKIYTLKSFLERVNTTDL